MLIRTFALVLATMLALPAFSADADVVVDTAERYLRLQTQGLPGTVNITMGKLDVNRLSPCTALEAYLPPNTRLNGKTYVGVRCLGPNVWNVLVPATIVLTGNYVVSAHPLIAGQVVQADDLSTLSGDLSNLPTGIVTNPTSAIGKTLRNSLGAGQPLRNDQLQAPLVIRQGQSVRVTSHGAGFSASSEGKAINNAAEGQVVQVRMNSGQTVSGIAKGDGTVEIAF